MSISRDASPMLFRALGANAAFSSVCGAVMALTASDLGRWLGTGQPGLIMGVGIGLLLFAGRLAWLVRQGRIERAEAWSIVVGDLAWVVFSIALLLIAADILTATGKLLVTVTAIAVAAFALLQAMALKPTVTPASVGTEGLR